MPKSIAEVHAELTAPGEMFEMQEVDIRGIPTRTWKNAPPTLRAVLELSRSHGDKPFLVYAGEDPAEPIVRTTFEQHFRQAATLAHRLVDQYGIRTGDRVAIAMRNFPEWAVAFWATAAAGAVVVPLNAWWTGPELEYGLSDSGTKVLVADAERMDRLDEHFPNLPGLVTLVVRDGSPGRAIAWEDVAVERATDPNVLPD